MQDLTKGSITGHLIGMAAFIGMGLVFQTLYFLVDLYFVSHIGKEAIAGVSAAGTAFFLVMAMTQLVGALGALSLIAQATGRKDAADADLVFNGQAMSFAAMCALLVLGLGYVYAGRIMSGYGADVQTAEQGRLYLMGFLPSLAAMFPSTAMGSGLRGTGVVKPTMIVQSLSVLLNVVLAPVLIAGWGTGHPLGVFGAGLASSIAVVLGLVVLTAVFPRVEHFLRIEPGDLGAPPYRMGPYRRHRPAGGGRVRADVRDLLGGLCCDPRLRGDGAGRVRHRRTHHAIDLPAGHGGGLCRRADSGQNYGAKQYDRVRETFRRPRSSGPRSCCP